MKSFFLLPTGLVDQCLESARWHFQANLEGTLGDSVTTALDDAVNRFASDNSIPEEGAELIFMLALLAELNDRRVSLSEVPEFGKGETVLQTIRMFCVGVMMTILTSDPALVKENTSRLNQWQAPQEL